MDSFLDSSDIGLCLSDMVDGDLKYSLELGLELTPYCGLGSGRSSPLLLPSVTELYSCCTTDPLDPGILVDPAAVVPRRQTETDTPSSVRHSHSILHEDDSPTDSEEDEDMEDRLKALMQDEDLRPVVRLPSPPLPTTIDSSSASHSPQPSKRPSNLSWSSKMSGSTVNGVSCRGKTGAGRVARTETRKESPSPVRPRQSRTSLNEYPKPSYSYSCLIAMALKNSPTGSLPVSEIYNFMCEHFPFFQSAAPGWKNTVRHNLSLNQSFKKIEKSHGGSRKGCLWALNPSKVGKMDEEMTKCSSKDPLAIKRAMKRPETLDRLERGEMKIKMKTIPIVSTPTEEPYDEEGEMDETSEGEVGEETVEEEDDDPSLPSDDEPSDDEGEVPPSLKPFERPPNQPNRTNLTNDIGVEFSEDVYEELGVLEEVLEEASVEAIYMHVPVKRSRPSYSYMQAITSHL